MNFTTRNGSAARTNPVGWFPTGDADKLAHRRFRGRRTEDPARELPIIRMTPPHLIWRA